jgi:hypothetical protein
VGLIQVNGSRSSPSRMPQPDRLSSTMITPALAGAVSPPGLQHRATSGLAPARSQGGQRPRGRRVDRSFLRRISRAAPRDALPTFDPVSSARELQLRYLCRRGLQPEGHLIRCRRRARRRSWLPRFASLTPSRRRLTPCVTCHTRAPFQPRRSGPACAGYRRRRGKMTGASRESPSLPGCRNTPSLPTAAGIWSRCNDRTSSSLPPSR